MNKLFENWRKYVKENKDLQYLLEGIGDSCVGERDVITTAQKYGNFYDYLNDYTGEGGVYNLSTDSSTIKKTGFKLLMRLHPDRNPNDPGSEEKFKNLSVILNILLNDKCREYYDTWLKLHPNVGKEDTSKAAAAATSKKREEEAINKVYEMSYDKFGGDTAHTPEGMCFENTCPQGAYEWAVFPDWAKGIFTKMLENMKKESEHPIMENPFDNIISKFQVNQRLFKNDIKIILNKLRDWKKQGKF